MPAQGTAVGYALTAHTTGPWQLAGTNRVCAWATATSTATGNAGFVELLAETPPADSNELCVQQNSPQDATVSMSLGRMGAATTALLSDLGDPQYALHLLVAVHVAATLFDGATLDLRPLAGTQAMSLSANIVTTVDPLTLDSWFRTEETGAATITLTGH